MNRAHSVNTMTTSVAAIERELLQKFQELLGNVTWLTVLQDENQPRDRDTGPDAVFRVQTRAGVQVELHVEAKANMRPSLFHAVEERWKHRPRRPNAVPVLGVPAVSQRLAEICQRAGWSWYDLAGNCWLNVPGFLYIETRGNRAIHRRPRERASLASTAAARLMRALLTPNHAAIAWRQRTLQANTCWAPNSGRPVSLGLVNKVIQFLVEQSFVTSTDEGVKLKDPVGLLGAWNRAYRFDRHQRLSYFTLLKGQRLAEALGETGSESGNMAAYAAFSAAERQAPNVTQPRTWVYVDSMHLDMLVRRTEAKEVDSGENLVVLIPDDIGVLASFTETEDNSIGERQLRCTDPVQTYVDLMHCGGRGEEAAQALLEHRLLPAWKAAGIA